MLPRDGAIVSVDRSACPSDRHGTASAARNHGCRCDDARRLLKAQRYRLATGRPSDPYVDATGTIRRRQGLLAIGWSCEAIADAAGLALRTVQCMNSYGGRTRASSADRMRRAYRHLLSLPRPTGPGVPQLIGQARRLGYQPPDVWASDDELDDPTALPDTAYRRADGATLVVEDIRWLMSQPGGRHTADEIGRLHGLDGESVARRLARAKQGAPGQIPDEHVHAIRGEYLRTRHTTWNGRAAAERWGVSTFVISKAIHGQIRPELGLSDLTAAGSDAAPEEAAASPAVGDDRKENDAA